MKPKISKAMREDARLYAGGYPATMRERFKYWQGRWAFWGVNIKEARWLASYNRARRLYIVHAMALEISINRHHWYREEFK